MEAFFYKNIPSHITYCLLVFLFSNIFKNIYMRLVQYKNVYAAFSVKANENRNSSRVLLSLK